MPPPPPPPPMLLTSHGEESEKHTFYNLLENLYQTTCIPALCNKSVLGSAYGWLVLVDLSERDCCLWNPTSMEIIEVPELDNPWPYNRCVLSKPPTDPDCFIVFNPISFTDNLIFYRIGDHAVLKLKIEENKEDDYRVMAMVSFHGMIYGIVEYLLDHVYEFVTIHMVGDTVETRPLLIDDNNDDELPWEVPQPTLSWIECYRNYLIESPCGNELLLVTKMRVAFYINSGMHFRVFRVDVSRKECEELENLDGRTIFISFHGNGFCRYSESFGAAIKPNSIYYTNEKGMLVYVYDLGDRSTMKLQPYPGADIDPATSRNFWFDLPISTILPG